MSEEQNKRSPLGTVLGWISGSGTGLLLSFIAYHSIDGMPVGPVVFGALVAGAFGGMALADRLGERAIRVLGIWTGCIAAAALLIVMVLGGS